MGKLVLPRSANFLFGSQEDATPKGAQLAHPKPRHCWNHQKQSSKEFEYLKVVCVPCVPTETGRPYGTVYEEAPSHYMIGTATGAAWMNIKLTGDMNMIVEALMHAGRSTRRCIPQDSIMRMS
eukprot:3791481-Amphidinium_carterae.1